MIIMGATRVTRRLEYSPNMHRVQFVDGRVHVAWLSELADAVHDYGAKIAVQLQPGRGRVATRGVLRTTGTVSASAVPAFFDPTVMTREITVEEIEHLIEGFKVAAETIRVAGIDAVELNFHFGYLGDSFMTALWNKRNDRYGGNLNGRLRFPLEIIGAVKKGAGSDFPVIYKFGLAHYLEGGRQVEESLEIARRLEAAGVDAFTIDSGCYDTWYWPFPTTYQPSGLNVDSAASLKKVVKVPVITVGKLGYPELAEQVLQEGKADFIALGRPLLADPEWPNKVKGGRWDDIRPCIGDNEGRLMRSLDQKYVSCTVNPCTGMEKELALIPAEKKKLVLVIGGGPGGMEAARVAALRGHGVTLWEKEQALGGALIPASVPDFKEDYRHLIRYFSTQLPKLGVAVELGKEATPELVQQMKPEVVIVATGAMAVVPEIPGADKARISTAVDILLGRKEAGESVLMIGGGIIGCETAVYLAQQGHKVIVVENLESVARDMYGSNRMYLMKMLTEKGVEIHTKTDVVEMAADGIVIAENSTRHILHADTVVCATGLRPQNELYLALQENLPEVYAIGDCVAPRKVINAIWEGYRTARLV